MRLYRRTALAVVLSALMASMSGCGGDEVPVYKVGGKVTMNGEPLKNVTVQFNPVDPTTGQAASGKVDDQGVYTLYTGVEGKEGAVPGKYIVTLTQNADANAPPEGGQYGQTGGAAGSAPPPQPKLSFPAAWASTESSPMKDVEVKSQDNTIDIDVK